MTNRSFQKALSISFLAHIAVFGSTLAYAYYTGGLSAGSFDNLTVSLVELGDEQNIAKSRMKKQTENPERQGRLVDGTFGVNSLPNELNRTKSTLDQDRDKNNEKWTDAEELITDSREDQIAGGRFGVIPPEAWERIKAALDRARYYPRLARRRGIEGEVRLRFRISPAGEVEKVEILKGSGHALLDSASIRTVYRAAPLPYVEGWLEVPLSFVLQ